MDIEVFYLAQALKKRGIGEKKAAYLRDFGGGLQDEVLLKASF